MINDQWNQTVDFINNQFANLYFSQNKSLIFILFITLSKHLISNHLGLQDLRDGHPQILGRNILDCSLEFLQIQKLLLSLSQDQEIISRYFRASWVYVSAEESLYIQLYC